MKITTENFKTLIENNDVVLVDFMAQWCGPCKMVGPIVDSLLEDNPNVIIGKCDVDENAELAIEYSIKSVPSLLFFKNGELVETLKGAQPKSVLQNKLNELI